MRKRRIATALILVLVLSFAAPTVLATAPEHLQSEEEISVQPRYTYISTINAICSISSAGKSTCSGQVTSKSTTYSCSVTVDLQQKSGTAWSTIKTWSGSGKGSAYASNSYNVSSGYSYRVKVTAKVYNSSGSLLETATTYSTTQTY